MIDIVQNKIVENVVLDSVRTDQSGAVILFLGTTRRFTGEKETRTLQYDAYHEMARKEFERLHDLAIEKWSLNRCAIVHRVGEVPIGEASVAVAVSAPHRVDAFEAASWIMDTLKKDVPIWKQEIWVDGETEWIHPDKTELNSN